jgi:hypothetical protein
VTATEPLCAYVPAVAELPLLCSVPNSVPAVPCVAMVLWELPLSAYHEKLPLDTTVTPLPEYDHARPSEPLVPVADQLSLQLLSVNPLAPHELLEPPPELSDPLAESEPLMPPPLLNEELAKPELLPLCVPVAATQLPPAPSVQ